EDLWGLHADEVRGKSFFELDIGLPVRELEKPIRGCLNGGARFEDVVVDARNRRGKPVRCRVTCTPLQARDGEPTPGVVVLMNDVEAAEQREPTAGSDGG